jgi:predicted CXXCH cytochrome family protein
MIRTVFLFLLGGATAFAAEQPAPPAKTPLAFTCLGCHADKESYKDDVHAAKGFSCTACHGGDATITDMSAMSKSKGFRGKIARARIPELCGSCHSDAALMRNYAPQMRVDQLAQYKTSVHGKKLAAGNTSVATCIDCHGVHGIRPVNDPRSTAFPIHQPETCGRCHKGKERKDYEQSVHWELLSKDRELSAPACATCHGSHGAAPPNVASVINVCGTCHVMLENLFQKSPHAPVFKAAGLRGCVECHGNHRIARTSDALVGDQAGAVCLNCHAQGDDGLKAARAMSAQLAHAKQQLAAAERGVHQAEVYGMEVSDARMEVSSANQALVQSRVLVHGLDLGAFDQQADKALEAARSAQKQGLGALHERDVRRRGLLISIAFILVTMVGLYLTIKTIERR